jgi:hypothetical protein
MIQISMDWKFEGLSNGSICTGGIVEKNVINVNNDEWSHIIHRKIVLKTLRLKVQT